MNRRQFVECTALFGTAFFTGRAITTYAESEHVFIAPGAKLEKLPVDFGFAEGPVADSRGDVYFSDWAKKRIYRWTEDSGLSLFMENAPGMVGMDLDREGNLILASTDKRAIISVDLKNKRETVLIDRYNGKHLNSPNDLWCDRKGGIYFTDPRFVQMTEPKEQDVEGVYYLPPDGKPLIRVIDDLKQPNGLTGSLDGKFLYVDDTPNDKTYVYTINRDGTLSGKKLFANIGYDGIKVDSGGNVYIAVREKVIGIYSPKGEKIGEIEIPQSPTNFCFGGKDRKTLFITTIPAVFTLKMRVKGAGR